MNEKKMKKCSGKTHSVVQVLLILWMTSLIHIAVGDVFPCSGSNMNVSATLVCDGYYNCDNYEDESLCNYPTNYLEEGQSHFIFLPYTTTSRFYNATLLQTYATNGFRVVFQDLLLTYSYNKVHIGTGNDPSAIQSVITTIHGTRDYADDVYVHTNEMWFAAIGGKSYTRLEMDVEIISINLSTLFACSSSDMSVSPTVLCDGIYHCDHYEDERACNYSVTYLQEGESHFISLLYTITRRVYNATLLQTYPTNGFRVVFQDLYVAYDDVVQIGTGNDPSAIQSVITTIHGTRSYADDVYVHTNEMWFAAITSKRHPRLRMDVEIISINLSTLFACSSSNMSVSPTVLCDGLYHCDHYEDESACNNSTYLQEGLSHFIYIPNSNTRRFYNATLLQTNTTNGFRVVFQELYLSNYDDEVQIGTGNDPSDIQSVITTIHGYRGYAPDDVYLDTNDMWFAVIGSKGSYSRLKMDVEIISLDLSNLLQCRTSGISFTTRDLCDGVYKCPDFADEAQCSHPSTFLLEKENHTLSFPDIYVQMYNASLLKTNATNGFRVKFLVIYLGCNAHEYGYPNYCDDATIKIGTGNDTANNRSIVKTVGASTSYEDDVYVGSNEMWIAVIGFRGNLDQSYFYGRVEIEVTPIRLSSLSPCSNSDKLLFQGEICDGTYRCDDYWDEKSCSHPDIFLHEGESFHITIPDITRRFYNRTMLRTNSTLGFRVHLSSLHGHCCGTIIVIGTGSDSRDIYQIFLNDYNYDFSDVYVTTNEMWLDVTGGDDSSYGYVEIDVTSGNLTEPRDLYFCSTNTNIGIQQSRTCDGINDCSNYKDESSCNQSAVFLPDGGRFPISWFSYGQQTYGVWLLETNSTNGFRIYFGYVYTECYYINCNEFSVLFGKGHDWTKQQSVNETYSSTIGYYQQIDTEWYVDSHEIWVAVIFPESYGHYIEFNIDITAVNISGLFPCKDSGTRISRNDVCNGRYECDSYADEISCDRSPITIREDESYAISNLELHERGYHVFILQTNSSYGFHIKFQHIFLDCCDMRVQIGTGTDPADDESVVRAIEDYTNYVDDFYMRTSYMWLVMTGGKYLNVGHVDIIVTAILVSEGECLTTPCRNGGTCRHVSDIGYRCDCIDPFIGQNCEIENECLATPCLNGGTCQLTEIGYRCECIDPFIGQNCDIENECLASPCLNGGTCQLTEIGYRCDCIDPFIGQNCDIDNTNPCTQRNLCANGVCSPIGQGQYQCECQDHYEGIHCEEPTLPLEIYVHPSSQIVNINANVEMTCGFNNAKRYHWYKDDVLLPNTENQNPLIILSVAPSDIGYYFCRGSGRNKETLDTMRASVYVKDLTTIQVLNARFAISFRDELHDKTSKLFRETAFNISTYVEQGLRTSTGLESLSVACRALGPGSVKADMNFYIERTNMTALETQNLIGLSLESLANESNGFLDSNSISVQDNAICQNISWISPRFERVEFPVGENGTWENSTGMCPFNTTQSTEPIGRALCIGDGITQSQWQPMDNCGPFRNVTDILTEIAQVIVSEENAGEVSQQVSSVTSNIQDITSDDLTFVAEITSNIVQQNITSGEVTESIANIASNIAEVEAEVLEAAEEEGGAISKFVQAFEEQISRVEVADGGMLNIQQPNIAVQVQSVPADDVRRGLVLSLAGSSLSDLTKSNITINAPTKADHGDVIATRPDIIAQVSIPPSVSSVISSTAPLSGSPSNGSGEYVRVNFNVFSTPALFISKSLRTISVDNLGFNRSANSPVITLSIGQGKVAALTEFINFTFTTIKSGYVNPKCSFWDEEEEDWSGDGCVLVPGFASSDERYDEEGVRCACDHLTNFAVIMDIHREGPSIKAYNILTYIGCSISIFSLLVTLATYLWNKDLRTKQTNQIFICLCLTLLCLYTTFVIMISLDSREVQAGPCGFLTALVQYFVLSSIAWMGVEGYNTYLIIVKIFNAYIQNFMIKAFLAAWGIPAFIVVLTGAIARDSYAHDDLCFLQSWAQIGGLLIPMAIILLINIVIFILVVRQLLRSANIAGRVKREAKEERRETIVRVQNAICIMLLLGLTWVTGYLLLIPSFSQVAQPIFVVLNSFQGFFIFLLYCVRKPHIRKKWGLTCFDKFLKREASTSSGVVSSTALSSTADMISKLRPGARGSYLFPTKDDNPDPMGTFNPTFDVSQVEEGVTSPMNIDIQSSTEEQNKDTDRNASPPLAASVTKSTKRGDGVSSYTNADTLSVTVDSTDVKKATEGTDDAATTNNDAIVGLPEDAAHVTIHNEGIDDDASSTSDAAVNLPMDSPNFSKDN